MDKKIKIGSFVGAGFLVVIFIIWLTTHYWRSTFEIHPPATWYEAVGNCTKSGRRLALIKNDSESKALYAFLTKQKLHDKEGLWMAAASFGAAPGTRNINYFRDVNTGEQITYHPWYIHENGDNDFNTDRPHMDCLRVYYLTVPSVIKRSGNSGLAWGNEQCDIPLRYVCV